MPPRISVLKKHRKVLFVSRNMAPESNPLSVATDAASTTKPDAEISESLQDKARIEELSSDDDDDEYEDVQEQQAYPFSPGFRVNESRRSGKLPPWLTVEINLFDEDLETDTCEKQAKVVAECLPLLTGEDTQGLELNSHGIPKLRRKQHVAFLEASLGPLPAAYAVVDPSRPWLFYWALQGLATLGEDVRHYKERLVGTLRPLQNPTGGFGGGHGHLSHCAGTYAAVLALANVDGLEMIDRKAMWQWLGKMKQASGGFTMALGAEEDIRGAYCAMTIITLLNLPLELPTDSPARHIGYNTFLDGLGDWISRCQTYEGGIAGAPTNEAHGAYAFCALACLSIIDAPHKSIPQHLDVSSLLRWLACIQTSPEGGFAGRTNKLVDACYSHWVGGCWALIQAAIGGQSAQGSLKDLWNREGLIRYLLCCGQATGKKGGMRDKPSTRADGYHTCYSLSGLSAAQHHYCYTEDSGLATKMKDTLIGVTKSGRLMAAFKWTALRATAGESAQWKFDEDDTVGFVHPVFVLPMKAVERTRKQFEEGGL